MNIYLYGTCFSILTAMIYYTFSGANLISSSDAKKMIKANKIKHIIDVRTETEWKLGHYKGAIHIPRDEISIERLKNEGVNTNHTILVYCNTGQRARMASEKMNDLGYDKVFYIAGPYTSII